MKPMTLVDTLEEKWLEAFKTDAREISITREEAIAWDLLALRRWVRAFHPYALMAMYKDQPERHWRRIPLIVRDDP
jgi:hypothetical protein